MSEPTITLASRLRSPHVAGVFADGIMIGWGPTFSGDDREIASRPDLAAFLRDAAIADGDGIGGEGYVFGDGSAW